MILHPIIKVGNIVIFQAKEGDGDVGKNMVIFIIVSLTPGQFFLNAGVVVCIVEGWDRCNRCHACRLKEL